MQKWINTLKIILIISFIAVLGTTVSQPSFKNSMVVHADDPTKKDSYEKPEGWPDWSQYGGSMLAKWGKYNYGCVTTSRVRGAARHGGTKIPSQVAQVAPFSDGEYQTISGATEGQNNKFDSDKAEDRIKQVSKIAEEEWKKNHEVMVRIAGAGQQYADGDGGTHTMMVSDIKDGKMYVMDPAVGAGGNWSSSSEAKNKIVRYEIDGGYKEDKQKGFSSSAVRAQMGTGELAPNGSASGKDADNKDGKNADQKGSDDIKVHRIFNPFQAPVRATDNPIHGNPNTGAAGDGSVSMEDVDAYNNVQKMSAMNSVVEGAYKWANYIAVGTLIILSAYMFAGACLYALDESAIGNLRLSDAASHVNGIMGTILHPGGYFMGIKPTDGRGMIMTVGHVFVRQTTVVAILLMAATGFGTWLFGQFFRLISYVLGGV